MTGSPPPALEAKEWLRISLLSLAIFVIAEAGKGVWRALEKSGAKREARLN